MFAQRDAEQFLKQTVLKLQELYDQYIINKKGFASFLLAEAYYQIACSISQHFIGFEDMLFNQNMLEQALQLLQKSKSLYALHEDSELNFAFIAELKKEFIPHWASSICNMRIITFKN